MISKVVIFLQEFPIADFVVIVAVLVVDVVFVVVMVVVIDIAVVFVVVIVVEFVVVLLLADYAADFPHAVEADLWPRRE